MPVLWIGNWIILLVILSLGIAIVRKNWKKGVSLLVTFLFIIMALGINKVNDDLGTLFFSSARMFLALPILLGLSLFWYVDEYKFEKTNYLLTICSIGIAVFLVKISLFNLIIDHHTKQDNFGAVAIKKIEELKDECSQMNELISRYNIDLMVFLPNWEYNVPKMAFYNYGCPIIQKQFSGTVMNVYENRTWVFKKESESRRKNILLYNFEPLENVNIPKEIQWVIINENPKIILIKNNDKTLKELSESFHFLLKRNTY